MTCNKCAFSFRSQAESSGECINCLTPIYSPHMPCDKLCVDCSNEQNRCQSCGEKMNSNGDRVIE